MDFSRIFSVPFLETTLNIHLIFLRLHWISRSQSLLYFQTNNHVTPQKSRFQFLLIFITAPPEIQCPQKTTHWKSVIFFQKGNLPGFPISATEEIGIRTFSLENPNVQKIISFLNIFTVFLCLQASALKKEFFFIGSFSY